ncbi:MAG: FAD-dependent oxidoreductase [Ferrimicrobium sp.]
MRSKPLIRGLRVGADRADAYEAAHNADRWVALTTELKPLLTSEEAESEAYRCLLCGGPNAPAPCTLACPTGIDIPDFIDSIVRGDLGRAASTIMDANPLGATCARVCPTEVLCEGSCVLLHEGQRPVDIGRLQRFAVESVPSLGEFDLSVSQNRDGRRVAVIGAGPAGMSCAAVLAGLGYSVAVYDGHREVGGLVRYAIAPYRELNDPLPDERRRIESMGVRFELESRVDSLQALKSLERDFDSIFLGIGMGEDAQIVNEDSDLPGVWSSLPFIEAIKSGELPYVGSRVAVIGGGNTAMDVAREAVRLGAEKVVVLYRRTRIEAPAFALEIAEAIEEGVEFSWLTVPVRFRGTGRIEAIECRQMRLGEPDDSGRRRPEVIEGSEFEVPVDTVIYAIGQQPRNEFLGWIDGLTLNSGHIVTDPSTGQTQNPQYFAGGDALNGGETVVEAVRMGKVAAQGIHHYLSRSEAKP